MTAEELIEKIKQASVVVELHTDEAKVEVRLIPEEAWEKLCKEVKGG